MAEEGKAQSKLGELFVDVGVGGLGKTIKALNTISASFLMVKTAATQAVKPFIDMSKEGGALAVTLKKLESVTGVSQTTWGKLKNWAEKNNVEFNMLSNTLGKLQQNLIAARANADSPQTRAFAALGIDPSKLNPDDPLGIMDEVQKALKRTTNKAVKAFALQYLELPTDMAYMFEQLNGTFSEEVEKTAALKQAEIDELNRQMKAWKEIGVSLALAKDRIIASLPIIAQGLEWLASKLAIFANDPKETTKRAVTKAAPLAIPFAVASPLAAPAAALMVPYIANKYISGNNSSSLFSSTPSLMPLSSSLSRSITLPGSVGNDILPALPNVAPSSYSGANITNYNTFDNQFTVMSNNPEEVGRGAANVMQQQLNENQMTNQADK